MSDAPRQLHDFTALEQANKIRSGEITSRQFTEHYLARTESLNAEVGAFITVLADAALASADASDELVRTVADPDELPVLHGVVCPTKDLNFMAGVNCSFGSRALNLTPPIDDDAVAAMRAGGLVFIGTTNTPEFGLPCYTENDIAPPARTPWDLNRSAGGSSGGAGAAVAAGLAPIAQGSDGGGSIRIPASACGLVGIKPSRGLVSNGPMPDGLGELVAIGPLARTVRDAVALLDTMAGTSMLNRVGREPGMLRIGRYATPVIADTTVDPQCLAAYEKATELLTELGHEVDEIAAPFPHQLVASFEVLWSVSARTIPLTNEQVHLSTPLTQWLRTRGEQYSAVDLAQAIYAVRAASSAAMAATNGYDVILTPTLAHLPAPLGSMRNDADPAADFESQKRFTPFTAPYNVTGQPAMTLPLDHSDEGLPIGCQFVGRIGGEETLIALAVQLEAARPWLGRTPSMW